MPMRNKLKLLYVMRLMKCSAMILAMIALVSCANEKTQESENETLPPVKSLLTSVSGDLEAYENSDLNTIEQAKPTIMVLPSDKTLQAFGCLEVVKDGDHELIIRNYQQYILKDDDIRPILSAIQSAFVDSDFPLNDLEQSLKQLNTQGTLDKVSGYAKDAKTLLLSTLRPDIVIEMSYDQGGNKSAVQMHSYGINNKKVNYTLTAYDAYTSKVVATINQYDLAGSSKVDAIKNSFTEQLPKLQNDLIKYFSEIVTKGRDVTVRITVAEGSNIKLSDESIEGDTYTDWIVDHIKTHTVKGAYKMQTNTDNELYFVNCKIKYFNEDGTQFGVYDWSRDLIKSLRRNLGLKCSNQSQGLGEVVLTIEGLR